MTEQWKITAAERFNEKIRMTPQELDDPPMPPLPKREPVTWMDHAELAYEANQRFVHSVVDTWKPRRVA